MPGCLSRRGQRIFIFLILDIFIVKGAGRAGPRRALHAAGHAATDDDVYRRRDSDDN